MTRASGTGDGGGAKTDWRSAVAVVAVILQGLVLWNQYTSDKSTHEAEQDERLLLLECAQTPKMGKCGGSK